MSADQIRLIIMNTGEHILGYVTADRQDDIQVDQPVSLVPDPNSQGQRMMFMPYLQFSEEEEAPFPKREIRHILTPNASLKGGYDKQFGAGILTPEPSNIILG